MKSNRMIPFLLTCIMVLWSVAAQAQCAMCKGSVQESEYAKSINDGVNYLLAAPIILVGAIILLWIKNKDKFMGGEQAAS